MQTLIHKLNLLFNIVLNLQINITNSRGIGVEVISIFEFIDGFLEKLQHLKLEILSKQDDIFWIEHNSQMEYYMQDTTRVINAVETWQTVIINENEQVIADQANQHTYIDGTGVAAVIIDTGVDAGHPDFDYDEGKTVSYKFDRATRTWIEAENSDTSSGHGLTVQELLEVTEMLLQEPRKE